MSEEVSERCKGCGLRYTHSFDCPEAPARVLQKAAHEGYVQGLRGETRVFRSVIKHWKCAGCGRAWNYGMQPCPACASCSLAPVGDADSTPPETPYAIKRRRTESLLPPRAVPGASVSATLMVLASTVAGSDSTALPLPQRAALVGVFAFVAWLIGYFTQPPRRKFRRGD